MTPAVWKCGFEIELMAPKGLSRETFAKALAQKTGGSVQRCFYPQSEIDTQNRVAGYETLTLGFEVLDASGNLVAKTADDITLAADINHDVEGADGWYRILSNQKISLDFVESLCSPNDHLEAVLQPLAKTLRTQVKVGPGGMHMVNSRSSTVAVALPLAGERERACEVITAPMTENVQEVLDGIFETAKELKFSIPKESATHIHFDGEKLKSPVAFRNIVAIFHRAGPALKARFGTNASCTRLGPWPQDFLDLVFSPQFVQMDWERARRALNQTSVEKWCDFNVLNLFDPFARQCTFEVRILPTRLDAQWLSRVATLFEEILKTAISVPCMQRTDPVPVQVQNVIDRFIAPTKPQFFWSSSARI